MAVSSAPTAPGRLPLLGHAHRLVRGPLPFMESLREQGPIVRVFIGPTPVHVLTEPVLTRQILVAEADVFVKGGKIYDALRSLLGHGVATIADGRAHMSSRRLMQPMFNKAHIATRGEAMIGQARELVGSWDEGVTRQNVLDDVSELTLRMFLVALFGAEVPARVQREIRQLVPVVMHGAGRQALLPGWLTRLPLPATTAQARNVARLRELADQVIELNQGTKGAPTGCPLTAVREPGGLFDTLLTAHDPHSGPLSRRQLQDEVITLLTTAIETGVVSTVWALYELIRNPEAQQRVRAELQAVCGDRPLRYEDLDALTYTRRVLQEAIRLYGPTWLITRTARRTVELGGYLVPEGATVVYSPYLLQHDPSVFPEPDRFDPDRWTKERMTTAMRGSYIPFGAGRRNCIGENLAWAEMPIMLGVIAQTWQQLELAPPLPRPKINLGVYPDRLSIIPYKRGVTAEDSPLETAG
ncbi:cytochrome P450 [Streptomyces sp. NPDC001415]